MADRLYIVKSIKETAKVRLVKGATQSQVARHIAADLFTIEPADPLAVAQAFADHGNIKIEVANGSGE